MFHLRSRNLTTSMVRLKKKTNKKTNKLKKKKKKKVHIRKSLTQNGEPQRYSWGTKKFVGCLTSQQHASASQGRICSDRFTCCHTEIEVADQTFYLTQSQYTDTGPTSPSTDPITPNAADSLTTRPTRR